MVDWYSNFSILTDSNDEIPEPKHRDKMKGRGFMQIFARLER